MYCVLDGWGKGETVTRVTRTPQCYSLWYNLFDPDPPLTDTLLMCPTQWMLCIALSAAWPTIKSTVGGTRKKRTNKQASKQTTHKQEMFVPTGAELFPFFSVSTSRASMGKSLEVSSDFSALVDQVRLAILYPSLSHSLFVSSKHALVLSILLNAGCDLPIHASRHGYLGMWYGCAYYVLYIMMWLSKWRSMMWHFRGWYKCFCWIGQIPYTFI